MCVTGWLAARAREHILIARVVMGLDRAFYCCYLDNKAHLFRSCHGIIIVVSWKVPLFDAWSCHGITKFLFFFLELLFGYQGVSLY
jgi:hypothetical protein